MDGTDESWDMVGLEAGVLVGLSAGGGTKRMASAWQSAVGTRRNVPEEDDASG